MYQRFEDGNFLFDFDTQHVLRHTLWWISISVASKTWTWIILTASLTCSLTLASCMVYTGGIKNTVSTTSQPHIMCSKTNDQDLWADVVPRNESVPVPPHPHGPLFFFTTLWHSRTGEIIISFLLGYNVFVLCRICHMVREGEFTNTKSTTHTHNRKNKWKKLP